MLKLFISGLDEGGGGGSGVGVARAVRLAFPEAYLVGIAYTGETGAPDWADCNEVWTCDQWEDLDLDAHERRVAEVLRSGAYWLPGLVQEVAWLSQVVARHPGALLPPENLLGPSALPELELAEELQVRAPAIVPASLSDWDLNAFGRRHGWRVSLRTAGGESRLVNSWQDLHEARRDLLEVVPATDLFLQQRVTGTRESLGFSAFQGQLLESAFVVEDDEHTDAQARSSRRISAPPDELASSILRLAGRLGWTGGGELEFVRDAEDVRRLVNWRPCFPTWSYAASIAGRNLPAQLLERVSGVRAQQPMVTTRHFVRTSVEAPRQLATPPVRAAIAHARGAATDLVAVSAQRKPHATGSPGGATLRPGAVAQQTQTRPDTSRLSHATISDVDASVASVGETPAWLFLPNTAQAAFSAAARWGELQSSSGLRLEVAYSLKTNPDDRLVELALASGLFAETISQLEVRKALALGFPPDRIVLNGPAKWWPQKCLVAEPVHAVFCDSIEELRRVSQAAQHHEPSAAIIGVRLRPPHPPSRFGIDLTDPTDRQQVAYLIQTLPISVKFGVHFHMGSNHIGLRAWEQTFEAIVQQARALEIETGRAVVCLDVGGGWLPDDWTTELHTNLIHSLAPRIKDVLSAAP